MDHYLGHESGHDSLVTLETLAGAVLRAHGPRRAPPPAVGHHGALRAAAHLAPGIRSPKAWSIISGFKTALTRTK